jgi:hypothetical protein
MTTHSLPLSYLMESIGEFVPEVELMGIQPAVVAFGYPVSPLVQQAVERVYSWLKGDSAIRTGDPGANMSWIQSKEDLGG